MSMFVVTRFSGLETARRPAEAGYYELSISYITSANLQTSSNTTRPNRTIALTRTASNPATHAGNRPSQQTAARAVSARAWRLDARLPATSGGRQRAGAPADHYPRR